MKTLMYNGIPRDQYRVFREDDGISSKKRGAIISVTKKAIKKKLVKKATISKANALKEFEAIKNTKKTAPKKKTAKKKINVMEKMRQDFAKIKAPIGGVVKKRTTSSSRAEKTPMATVVPKREIRAVKRKGGAKNIGESVRMLKNKAAKNRARRLANAPKNAPRKKIWRRTLRKDQLLSYKK